VLNRLGGLTKQKNTSGGLTQQEEVWDRAQGCEQCDTTGFICGAARQIRKWLVWDNN